MEHPKGEKVTEATKINEGGRSATAVHRGMNIGETPSQTAEDKTSHVGESKLCTCRTRKEGGATSDMGEAEVEVARVEGRVYCLLCALLIPTSESKEENTKDIKPQVILIHSKTLQCIGHESMNVY